jgi:hypothetical protein
MGEPRWERGTDLRAAAACRELGRGLAVGEGYDAAHGGYRVI